MLTKIKRQTCIHNYPNLPLADFNVEEDEYRVFFHLAWMVCSNAVLPYIYFTDKGKQIIGNICQYANLHISTITPEADKNLLAGIAKSKFEPIKANDCGIRHSLASHVKNNPIFK